MAQAYLLSTFLNTHDILLPALPDRDIILRWPHLGPLFTRVCCASCGITFTSGRQRREICSLCERLEQRRRWRPAPSTEQDGARRRRDREGPRNERRDWTQVGMVRMFVEGVASGLSVVASWRVAREMRRLVEKAKMD